MKCSGAFYTCQKTMKSMDGDGEIEVDGLDASYLPDRATMVTVGAGPMAEYDRDTGRRMAERGEAHCDAWVVEKWKDSVLILDLSAEGRPEDGAG